MNVKLNCINKKWPGWFQPGLMFTLNRNYAAALSGTTFAGCVLRDRPLRRSDLRT